MICVYKWGEVLGYFIEILKMGGFGVRGREYYVETRGVGVKF